MRSHSAEGYYPESFSRHTGFSLSAGWWTDIKAFSQPATLSILTSCVCRRNADFKHEIAFQCSFKVDLSVYSQKHRMLAQLLTANCYKQAKKKAVSVVSPLKFVCHEIKIIQTFARCCRHRLSAPPPFSSSSLLRIARLCFIS